MLVAGIVSYLKCDKPMNGNRQPSLTIVIANEPRLLRDMLSVVLAKTPGLTIIPVPSNLQEVSDIFQQVRVDWLIVTLNQTEDLASQVRMFMHQYPQLAVLAISMDGELVHIWSKSRQGYDEQQFSHEFTLKQMLGVLYYKWQPIMR